MTNSKKDLTLSFEVNTNHLPDPLAANWVGLSRLAEDFVLQIGWMNIPALVEELKRLDDDAELKVTPKITHQFFMTRSGFLQLHSQVVSFANHLRAQGVRIPNAEAAADGVAE